ncbi:poly(U)-specific 3'-to-5' RNA exonuclease [Marasmius tenuissimus]|uniref:U6 snRNA phosphodiesterase 1 n=1 Tax=Marasmius tenuissimus TaxID=585030 RepID=A0ABR3A8D0_9AGAR
MKRSSTLVDYGSSSEEETVAEEPVQVKKKRKLPPLQSSVIVPVPNDDPSLHQGRIRSTPHVEGQWAVHVYISVIVEPRSPLHQLLQNVLKTAKESCPALQLVPGLDNFDGDHKTTELHISLSRPLFVRAYQKEEVKRSVRRLAQSSPPFKASFSSFSRLPNDENTRTFVALDIGGGFPELKSLTERLTSSLQSFRQKVYYDEPRFHASIAWALLESPPSSRSTQSLRSTSPGLSEHATSIDEQVDPPITIESILVEFPRIPQLPESTIAVLNEKYKGAFSTNRVGTFDVRRVHLKIGKEVFVWQLDGE